MFGFLSLIGILKLIRMRLKLPLFQREYLI